MCQVFICIILLTFTTFLWNRYYHPYFADKKSHSPKVDTDLKPSILWYAWLLFLIPSTLSHVVNLRRKILVENNTGLSSFGVAVGWVGLGSYSVGLVRPGWFSKGNKKMSKMESYSSVVSWSRKTDTVQNPFIPVSSCFLCQSLFSPLPYFLGEHNPASTYSRT